MINSILASWTPGAAELLIILIISLILFGIPVLVIILFVRHLVQANKERQRLRLKLGKLADELEQVRKKAEGGEKSNSSANSK